MDISLLETVVCKKHYMTTLDQEILNSDTFREVNETSLDICNRHRSFLKQFGLKSSDKIPYLYWIAKLHKTPIGKRFITSGNGASTQNLSILVGSCLKLILKIILNDSSNSFEKKGIRKCFVINNRNPVLDFIRNSNKDTTGIKSVKSFDFETLYTSIPQTKLKEVISLLIQNVYNSRNKNYITVTKSGRQAYFSINKSKTGFSVTANDLIRCINFITDNSFIVFKGKLFRQITGIPMGTNSAPYLANLFLHCYEIKYINHLIETNQVQQAKLLSSIFRYQDDCIVFNDSGFFSTVIKDIYPDEMVLKETNISLTECNYLDIKVKCSENGIFSYCSYDKRLDYDFQVINYPDLSGNIPKNQSYGVFVSQLSRLCEINGVVERFYSDVNLLVIKLRKLGYDGKELKAKFLKFYCSEMNRWSKFGVDISDFGIGIDMIL